jgi:hypothetical protein
MTMTMTIQDYQESALESLTEVVRQQIEELKVEEEEAREAGQGNYADGIFQALSIIAGNFGITLEDEDYPQGEEDDSEDDDPEEGGSDLEEQTIPATKAVLKALGAGVRDLNDGDVIDRAHADEVVDTMNKQGYSMSGYEFTSDT